MEKQDLEIRNRHGKRIGVTIRTSNSTKGTALVLHGLGGWREQPVIATAAETLVDLGYVSVTFDAADGARGPDNDFFNSTTSGYLEDVEDVAAWIATQNDLQTPFILVAHSAGALAAVRYAKQHPENVRKLILMAPAISWKSGMWVQVFYLLWWLISGSRPTWDVQGRSHRRKPLGRRWVLDFFSYDGNRDAACIEVPMLVVSAEKDHTVAKPSVNKKFAKHFIKGTHMLVAGASHDFLEHLEAVAAILREWLTQS